MTIFGIKAASTKAGKPVVIVTTPEKPQGIFLAFGQWTNKGLSLNLEAYLGGVIEVVYFQKGEELLNGDITTDSDVIVKDFMVQMNATVLAGAVAAENASKMQSFSDAASAFRVASAAKRAKAAEPVAPTAPAVAPAVPPVTAETTVTEPVIADAAMA